jgi:hypothetical protein
VNEIALSSADWAERIAAAWRSSVQGILEAGRLIAQAKAALPHGEFAAMIDKALPFGARTAQRLMAIAADELLANPTHVSHLPASWGTLYEITKLSDDQFVRAIASGAISPDSERGEVRQAFKPERRAEREAELGARQCALPSKKYGVIYGDYARRFNVRSRETGLDRSPENHYSTMTFAQIVDLPVPEIAAPDCVLFFWSTAASLVDDLEIMAEWGFAGFRPRDDFGRLKRVDGVPLPPAGAGSYRSHQIWLQDRLGLGYWFRDIHEILLVGARGNIVAPAPGQPGPLRRPGAARPPLGEAGAFRRDDRAAVSEPKIELKNVVSPENFVGMREEILALAKAIPVTIAELTKIYEVGSSMGVAAGRDQGLRRRGGELGRRPQDSRR